MAGWDWLVQAIYDMLCNVLPGFFDASVGYILQNLGVWIAVACNKMLDMALKFSPDPQLIYRMLPDMTMAPWPDTLGILKTMNRVVPIVFGLQLISWFLVIKLLAMVPRYILASITIIKVVVKWW